METTIEISTYNPIWPKQFEQLKTTYENALGDTILAVEHVGSTSVPGLDAKPILDIDIIVASEIQLNKAIPFIELLGYQFMGDMGIKDRYSFKQVSEYTPNIGTAMVWPLHNLYCCLVGSTSLNNHLLFRNFLRNSPSTANQYAELKKKLALTTSNIDVYVESKSLFIASVLNEAGILPEQIEDIILQNKKNP